MSGSGFNSTMLMGTDSMESHRCYTHIMVLAMVLQETTMSTLTNSWIWMQLHISVSLAWSPKKYSLKSFSLLKMSQDCQVYADHTKTEVSDSIIDWPWLSRTCGSNF